MSEPNIEDPAPPTASQITNHELGNGAIRTKPDSIHYAAIFEPGLHLISESSLLDRFVKPFADQSRRIDLVGSLQAFLAFLKNIEIRCDVWLDGSFTTFKEEPEDIDLTVFIQTGQIDRLSDSQFRMLEDLKNRGLMRARFLCDVYVERANVPERIAHWRETYERGRKGAATKGIPVLRVGYE